LNAKLLIRNRNYLGIIEVEFEEHRPDTRFSPVQT
jgi:hypothetical protein